MKTFRLVSALCLFASAVCFTGAFLHAQNTAKTATVTFYSQGNQMTLGVPGTKHSLFFGRVFDGQQLLFSFHAKSIVSFTLPAGSHTFSAGYGKKQPRNNNLSVTLQPGNTYMLRAQSEASANLISDKGRLEVVSCETARKETAGYAPLDQKKIAPQMVTAVITTQMPIVCP
jgi:hypothetical protein